MPIRYRRRAIASRAKARLGQGKSFAARARPRTEAPRTGRRGDQAAGMNVPRQCRGFVGGLPVARRGPSMVQVARDQVVGGIGHRQQLRHLDGAALQNPRAAGVERAAGGRGSPGREKNFCGTFDFWAPARYIDIGRPNRTSRTQRFLAGGVASGRCSKRGRERPQQKGECRPQCRAGSPRKKREARPSFFHAPAPPQFTPDRNS